MAEQDLYGSGGDKYAGYATSIPMDEEDEEDEPRPGIGGPRCALRCACMLCLLLCCVASACMYG